MSSESVPGGRAGRADAATPLLAAAIAYTARGWRLIPVRPDKKPYIDDWQHRAFTDLEMVERWFGGVAPVEHVAINCASSNLVVIDVDGDSGAASWQALLDDNNVSEPDTLIAQTPRGRHLFFTRPADRRVRTRSAIRLGIDVRAGWIDEKGKPQSAGYVIVPPGRAREWLDYEAADLPQPMEVPDWLLRVLEDQPAKSGSTPAPGQQSAPAEDWATLLRGVREGERNATAAKLAGHLIARGLEEAEVVTILTGFAARCTPPMDPAEVPRVVSSISRAEQRNHPERQAPAEPGRRAPDILGTRHERSGRLILSPSETLPTGEAYLREYHHHAEGRTLHHFAGSLFEWRDNRYVQIEDGSIKQRLHSWLHDALQPDGFDAETETYKFTDFKSNPRTVHSALLTICALTHLPATTRAPSWIGSPGDRPSATEILSCKTKNLHLPTLTLSGPSPAFFNFAALDFDFDANAPLPKRWLGFLNEIFSSDQESIDLLQDWFGYALTADTSQQKMLLIVGPRRSGKGTIARVLTQLVGATNVVAPTTSSLAGPFGLQPLVGKSLAIVSDARFSGENISTVVERLLCISGEDAISVDRKFKDAITLKLPLRFVVLTNELPRFSDSSAALAGRFLVLRLTKSFFGQENIHLTEELLAELPGILSWAIEGWRRLRDRGHFVEPTSSRAAVQDLQDLSSPVSAFLRERCIVGPGHRVACPVLYAAWQSWCTADGRTTCTTNQTFGRDLAAAAPGVVRRQGTHRSFYEGVKLQ